MSGEASTLNKRRTALLLGLAALPLLIGGYELAGAQTGGVAAVTVAVSPYRILDTRNGTGTGGLAVPVGPGQTITLQVSGVGPVPADATGVVLNITATEGTEASFVSAWPSGESQPNASVLNVNVGLNLPNMVTAALGAGGRLDLFNLNGRVHLVADVAGYLVPGSGGGTQGPQGPQGPAGPPGDPSVVAGTTTLVNADWINEGMGFSSSQNGGIGQAAERASIVVPGLTQEIIDRGSVEVSIRPEQFGPEWTPLPFWFESSTASFAYVIDVRYEVGVIYLYRSHQDTDKADATPPPDVHTTTLADLPVRWVIRPG